MMVHEKDYRQQNLRLLRQLFFEKRRLLYLEGQLDPSYGAVYAGNDPTLPGLWATSPRAVIDQILHLDHLEIKRIGIIIDSPGGLVSQYLNLYDIIQTASSPIYTIAMGVISSAAASVLAGGTPGKRFIFASSRTMIHLPRGGAQGDDDDLEKQAKELKKTKDKYIGILSRHTGKTPEEIEQVINRKDHWMNAIETVSFGLADKVVENFTTDVGI